MHISRTVQQGLGLFILIIILPTMTFGASLSSQVSSLLVKDTGLQKDQQAVCIRDEGGDVVSLNADMRIIPASVSKVYVFDFALSKLPEDFRFTTTFIPVGKTLYINGGGDAHFVIAHMREVLKTIRADKSVTFDRFVFSPNFYFNWQSKPKDVQMGLFRALKAEKGLPIASKISVVIGSAPYTGKGQSYEFKSAPLSALIKQINDYSTNVAADALFAYLGGTNGFAAYMQETYGVGNESIRFTTGSGLTGNYTTCELTLRVLEHLSETADEKDLAITDIMSVPTIDPGVLKKRGIEGEYAEALVAKSGFINYHHTLAGAINTKEGLAFFAIFTKYATLAEGPKVKSAIDIFVNTTAESYSKVLKSFQYTPDLTIFKNIKIAKLLG